MKKFILFNQYYVRKDTIRAISLTERDTHIHILGEGIGHILQFDTDVEARKELKRILIELNQ